MDRPPPHCTVPCPLLPLPCSCLLPPTSPCPVVASLKGAVPRAPPVPPTPAQPPLHERRGAPSPLRLFVQVGVHIADVSWFVRPGGLLDGEAAARCTTVYLVDRR